MSKKIAALTDKIASEFLADFSEEEVFSKSDIRAIIMLAVTETFQASVTGYFDTANDSTPGDFGNSRHQILFQTVHPGIYPIWRRAS